MGDTILVWSVNERVHGDVCDLSSLHAKTDKKQLMSLILGSDKKYLYFPQTDRRDRNMFVATILKHTYGKND